MSDASISIDGFGGNGSVNYRRVPPLREELELHPGAPTIDGAPTWVIQDPIAHNFFQLGWVEFELLSRWHMGTVEEILEDFASSRNLDATEEQIIELAEFLAVNNLFQARGQEALQRFKDHASLLRKRDLTWLLKNYLFIRIPLVNPDRFLERSLSWVRWMGSPAFLWLVLVSGIVGVFLAQRQWQGFLNSFPYFFTWQGALLLGSALIFSKILHEFGHAWSAKNFGCRIPSMGVAFLVMWPVLYTDTTDAWRLTSRRKRIVIGAAGIITELAIAAIATLLWSFMDDGPLRSAMLLLATTTWILTLLVNLNPFMRFDGYYILSDFLGVPNLQDRAFALARWRMREWLFGLNEETPESFPARTHKLLLIYAFGTWIYRFFLFLGIALLVYHFFFKLLGVFLMVVELAWFVGRPVVNEFKAWFEYRESMRWNINTFRLLILLAGLALLLIYPWKRDVRAPAIWSSADYSQIYMPIAARVDSILVKPGDEVLAGQTIFELSSPELDFAIRQGELRIQVLNYQLEARSFDADILQRSRVIIEEREAALSQQNGRILERDELLISSPMEGQVRDMLEPLSVGDWLPDNELLTTIVAPDGAQVEAWVAEADLGRIQEFAEGRFFPDDLQQASFPIVLSRIDAASSRQITELILTSDYGGEIATREDANGNLVPENPVYHVLATAGSKNAPQQIMRGSVSIPGSGESIILRLWNIAVSAIIKESSF